MNSKLVIYIGCMHPLQDERCKICPIFTFHKVTQIIKTLLQNDIVQILYLEISRTFCIFSHATTNTPMSVE